MENGEVRCICPKAVTLNIRFVCGSDGQSYVNLRVMRVEACLNNKIVNFAYEGKCAGKLDTPFTNNGYHMKNMSEI
mgnify:CR=1 FL=1